MFLLDQNSWEIRPVPQKGRGVFATAQIAAGTVIGDYLGQILTDDDAGAKEKEQGFYSMLYGPTTSIYPRVDEPGIHLINHSCMPNCGKYPYHGHMLFFALRTIFAEEEYTLGYDLMSPDVDETDAYPCRCGTLLCRGTMYTSVEKRQQWDEFVARQQADWINETRDIGTWLGAFSQYPPLIEDQPIYSLFANLEQEPYLIDGYAPTVDQIRLLLRQQGRILHVPTIHQDIIGVTDQLIISRPI